MITGVKEWPACLRFFSFQCLEMRFGTALLISGNFGTALLISGNFGTTLLISGNFGTALLISGNLMVFFDHLKLNRNIFNHILIFNFKFLTKILHFLSFNSSAFISKIVIFVLKTRNKLRTIL